jgi:hypothetical protein
VTLVLKDNGGTANGGVDTSAPQTFTIRVTPLNDNPTARPDGFAVTAAAQTLRLHVLTNDSSEPDAPETLTLMSVAAGQFGTTALSADGTAIVYTPGSSFAGRDRFTYIVQDGNGGSAQASVIIGPLFAAGADAGATPMVRVYSAEGPTLVQDFLAYGAGFGGGVRVAMGDINGDEVLDLVMAAGAGGGPHVRVLNGATGLELAGPLGSFFAYGPAFSGGIFLATADVNGDGFDDIITGAGAGGGPHVRVISGQNGADLYSFFAFGVGFTGGVGVAAGDVDGDGKADIIAGAGPSGGPHVRVFSGATSGQLPELIGSFFAYGPGFTGGVWVAAGDVNGDQRADVIAGAGATGGPHVRVLSGLDGSELHSYFAYAPTFTGGIRVAAADANGDGIADLITGAGPTGGPHLRVVSGTNRVELASFFAFDPAFTGGIFVAGVPAVVPPIQTALAAGMSAEQWDLILAVALQEEARLTNRAAPRNGSLSTSGRATVLVDLLYSQW